LDSAKPNCLRRTGPARRSNSDTTSLKTRLLHCPHYCFSFVPMQRIIVSTLLRRRAAHGRGRKQQVRMRVRQSKGSTRDKISSLSNAHESKKERNETNCRCRASRRRIASLTLGRVGRSAAMRRHNAPAVRRAPW
jgi:hypothetical protein